MKHKLNISVVNESSKVWNRHVQEEKNQKRVIEKTLRH